MIDIAIELLEQPQIALPRSKAERKQLQRAVNSATPEQPLAIYVGSCPDYSHEGGLYTHQALGDGVPLLTKYHIDAAKPLLKTLDSLETPYRYTTMVADVEGTDPYFCQRFAQGDEQGFLGRCADSVAATSAELKRIKDEHQFVGELNSSSFFQEFGREQFIALQSAYQEVLKGKHSQDGSFQSRVTGDIIGRMDLYTTMYSDIIRKFGVLTGENIQFLETRTLRTMAQYLALGRLISAIPNAVIINHPTRNLGLFNDRNRYHLPEDGSKPQLTVPVFEMKQAVYK